jgi:hypothetical protein
MLIIAGYQGKENLNSAPSHVHPTANVHRQISLNEVANNGARLTHDMHHAAAESQYDW